ncbi:MAG: hypothetical protein U1A72_00425 [Sulfuritalea sp.]|nr:hypothetical protein [Sulfuritalea sp.]
MRLTLVVGAGWVLAATQPTPKTLFVLVAWAMAAYRILTALSVKITDWLWA